MTEVKYRDGRGPAQRIADRLRCSSPASGQRPSDRQSAEVQKETVPNRTITNVYFGGANSKHGGNSNG
jgi:hypothetical protein